ncbi:alpha-(1,6)-fucosyltransferase-like [Penaeus chinensis]|uniref:alpha-(1,6)-fucosyltransferase-like n=1 Tax=Penaeus chinensis TaxID=139456 RepID=UPI001FB7F319|nr:alpha-(1,6)-fucosyltransferase-like [Penaeus chinensis]
MDFMEKVKKLPMHDKKLMSSDVDFLFTNGPLDDVRDFLERELPSSSQKIPVPVNCFIRLIRVSVTDNATGQCQLSINYSTQPIKYNAANAALDTSYSPYPEQGLPKVLHRREVSYARESNATLLSLKTTSNDSDGFTIWEEQDFLIPDKSTPGAYKAGPRLHENADVLFRQIENDVYNTKQFILAQLRLLKSRVSNTADQDVLTVLTEDITHHFRVTQYDIWRFRTESGLQAWQTKEVQELSDLIQHRIHALQNPTDCASAKKLLCNYPLLIKTRGMGSQIHHLSYCAIAAYGTQRTLIIKPTESSNTGLALSNYFLPPSENCTTEASIPRVLGNGRSRVVQFPDSDKPRPRPSYLPKSVPRDIAQRLMNAHGDPFAWWMGQLSKYILRLNGEFKDYIEKQSIRLGYESPVVGLKYGGSRSSRRPQRYGARAPTQHDAHGANPKGTPQVDVGPANPLIWGSARGGVIHPEQLPKA